MFKLFNRPTSANANQTLLAEENASLRRELQAVRLDLEETKKIVEQLRQQSSHLAKTEPERINSAAARQFEEFFLQASSALTQLLLQKHWVEKEGKPVSSQDVLKVAVHLIRAFEEHGLKIENEIGEMVSYDPNLHEFLNANDKGQPGDQVRIRFNGFSLRGKIIRKARVDQPA